MNTYIVFFENIVKLIEYNFFYSLLFFSFFIILYSALSLPGLPIFIVFAGYVFGPLLGLLVCIIPTTLGSFCFFFNF